MELSVSPTVKTTKPAQNITPICGSAATSVKKTHFTPCRQQGLKRKSPGTPNTPGNSAGSSVAFKSHNHSFETPTRRFSFPQVEDSPTTPILSPHEPTQSTSALNDRSWLKSVNDKPTRGAQLLRKRLSLHKNVSQPDESSENKEYPTQEMLEQLQKQVQEKQEQLNKLKLEQSRIIKGQDTIVLLQRIDKWRTGCQNALRQLQEKTLSLGHQVSMSDMITQLRIPFELVNFDPNDEDFDEN